jgi:hypothetical protein
MQSSPDRHPADRQLRGPAALITLAAVVLIVGVAVWHLMIVHLDTAPQSVGQAADAVAIVPPLIVGRSTLLLFLLLLSATFLCTGRRGAFIENLVVLCVPFPGCGR